MHGYFLFPCRLPTRANEQALVIFCATTTPDAEDLGEQLRRYCDLNPPPDRIYIIASEAERALLIQAVGSDDFVNRLPAITRQLNTPVVETLCFDHNGRTESEQHCAHIRRMGMTHVFRLRSALLEATSAHHYVKPSERHCDKFLRAANALVDGAEIDFLAFCCLNLLPTGIRRIYCDTGAISAIAYAFSWLRKRLLPTEPWPSIDSFGSYEGMREFQFREMEDSFVLLSASTSGGLAKGLVELDPKITTERIVTVFYLGDDTAYGRVACRLRFHQSENPKGYEPLVSFAPHECQLCSRGSMPIPIEGDHFLPEGIRVESIIIRASDSPTWLSRFIQDVQGTQLLRVNYQVPNSTGATKEVFLDLQRMFEAGNFLGVERFRRRFDRMVAHGASTATKRLIHLDDPGSAAMAYAIRGHAGLPTTVDVRSLTQVEQDLEGSVLNEGMTLVVAGAVASGSSLLAASQVLRRIQTNGSANYMIGIARTPDVGSIREVRNHVTYGEQPEEHGFYWMERVFLPMSRSGRLTVWDQERALLIRLYESTEDQATRALIDARISDLDNGASNAVRGLWDAVFLPKSSGMPLVLRPGFAFLDFEYLEGAISQSETFFAIATTLHQLRMSDSSRQSLTQHSHVRRVISPRCFERFNDGVIQASLLRAALTPELDYSLSDQLGIEMERVLDFVLTNAANESGEAAREFVLALAMQRLRLPQLATKRLRDKHSGGNGDLLLRRLWLAVGFA